MVVGCLSGSGADEMPSFEFFLVVLKLRLRVWLKTTNMCSALVFMYDIKSMTQREFQQESQWTKTCDQDNA